MRHFFLFGWLLIGGQTAMAQPLTVRQIFDKTIAVYATADTYQDTGEVVNQTKNTDPHWYDLPDYSDKKTFTTAYIRKTGQCRFQYKRQKGVTGSDCYLIWSDNRQTKSWWAKGKQLKQEATLTTALSTAGGVSGGASKQIPDLLLKGNHLANWTLYDLVETALLPVENQAGKNCYHIRGALRGKYAFGATAKASKPLKGPTVNHPAVEVWIDMKTFLIIRITETYNETAKSYNSTLTYHPVLNQPVKPEALVFDYKNCQ